jgi:hypothetical protein
LDKPATPVLPIKRDETAPDVAMKDVGLNMTKRAPATPDLAAMLSNPHAPISAPNPRSNADVPQPLEHSAIDRQYSRDMTDSGRDTANTILGSMGEMPNDNSDDMAVNSPTVLYGLDPSYNPDPVLHSNAQKGNGYRTQDMAVAGTAPDAGSQTLHTNKEQNADGSTVNDAVVAGGLLHANSQSSNSQQQGRRDVPVDEPNSTDDKVITAPGGQPLYHEHKSEPKAMRAHNPAHH